MDSEGSAFGAANTKHHRYMVFGKKQRYIEVFQCSGEDMSVVLTGGAGGQPGKPGGQPGGGQPGGGLVSPGMLPSVVPGYVDPALALAPPQPGLLPLGVPQLLPQLPQLPQLLPAPPRPDQLWVGGLGGLPQVAPQLLMFPPRLGLQLPPQPRYLLPSPAQQGGNKRTHEQAFLPATAGAFAPTLPPKRPPVMYNTGGGSGGGGGGQVTPPATPGLLPTPGVFPVQGAPSSVAPFPAV